jgi:Zn ribbon nucleic-acid-binding protein
MHWTARRECATIVCTANVKVTASTRGIPRCPSCHEHDAIEPLQQLDDVWHVRCLNCRCGFTFETPPRLAEERRRRADRRAIARSGRRATDLPHPVTCDACQGPNVKGWIRTGETLWARCADCGRVQRVPTPTDVLV